MVDYDTDEPDRLSDCIDTFVDRLSALDIVTGIEWNGYITHPRLRIETTTDHRRPIDRIESEVFDADLPRPDIAIRRSVGSSGYWTSLYDGS